MKSSQEIFRLSQLAVMIAVASASLSSHAVYNLYKKDGLTLDVNGQIDMQAVKTNQIFKLEQEAYDLNALGVATNALKKPQGSLLGSTDKKPRLGQEHGVSYVDFRGAQLLPQDWRVTGNIGLAYDSNRQLYLSNSSLSFDKKNQGAISLGRQYLHTGYVNRTGTYTTLDIFSTSNIRVDYTAVPGLHASAYYSFTGSSDVRRADNQLLSGFGASASYRHSLTDTQSIRVAAGISNAKYNPVITAFPRTNLNENPEKTQGLAASVEYNAGRFLVAADIGRLQETMSASEHTPLNKANTNFLGAKVSYNINPVWQVSTGYGVKKTTKTLKAGAKALYSKPANNTSPNDASFVRADERSLFDNIDSTNYYVQMDYRIRPNVRLYGRFDSENVVNKLKDQTFSQLSDKNYRAGVVFTF